ncbi:flagellar M-ring protein FliF [Cereibacter sphaeroides]|uniref:flagellar basal-body MS-ring/collar protein FliF n=1 Tax=Cereibacter sphaeroides TaxID=1063 RepID=UPI001F3548A2|nr:flagellar basal-body MS-ring/collar protein FliF [Cereibacter sphaeroides]MCE6961920.1 flagellar M-ring protein FliF [Cereibacter sphaeroides]MCE6970695.1 flagellar M-ring protein FliF [Cereibacter sphaeroides]MCE6975709.1 flagellar M-ring protein FliF [Cereibacter sphaeroides]
MALSPTPPAVRGSENALVAQVRGALTQVQRFADQPGLRRAMPAIVILSITAMALAGWFLMREPARMTLYPGLPEAEKARVIDTLTGGGIDAVVDARTGDIAVPKADYHRARMLLASQGLPQGLPDGGVMLDNLPMGTSKSVETARLRQAQELDLARSITEIAAVSAARVHLALPERSAFLRDSQPPRASVFLQVAPGRALDGAQVEAIVNLVSSSVPGMARQDVTVVDQMGRLLSRGSDDPGALVNDRQLQHRVQMETLYRNRIESLLTPIAGPGNLAVQVTIDMDFTRQEIREEQVDPERSALLSEQSQVEESADPQAKGIPGAVSNTPPAEAQLSPEAPAKAPEAAQPALRSRSTGSTRNFEISRKVETTQPATARIMRISAAVLVRAQPQPAAEDPEAPPPPLLPDALKADLERLTRSAIGFDEGRGDAVTITAQPFLDTIATEPAGWTSQPWVADVARQVFLLAALAVVALGVVRPILNRVLLPAPAAAGTQGLTPDEAAVEVGEGESLDDVRARLKARQGALTKNMLDAAKSHEEQILVIRKLVEEDAGRIATTFRQMIASELDTVN